MSLRAKEQELIKFISEHRQKPDRLASLEYEADKIRTQAARPRELEKECQQLTEIIKALPQLEQRKISLEGTISKYQAEEKEVAAKEANLKQMVEGVKLRVGWMSLATLEQRIHEVNKELNELSLQIEFKRSLLDKIIRWEREGK